MSVDELSVELSDYKKVFLGECKGIGLSYRGPGDKHVCMTILVEDDGNWFASSESFSSAWLLDLQSALQDAASWITSNCKPDMHEGVQYGWKFK